MYVSDENYLNTANPYSTEEIKIEDKTANILLISNIPSIMTDFTGQCLSRTCYPQFLTKPIDQIIRLNIPKALKLDIFHPLKLLIATSYEISNEGEDIIT
jgi:hypothetical protein